MKFNFTLILIVIMNIYFFSAFLIPKHETKIKKELFYIRSCFRVPNGYIFYFHRKFILYYYTKSKLNDLWRVFMYKYRKEDTMYVRHALFSLQRFFFSLREC